MSSLNLDIDYFSHPKTKNLVRLLGKGADLLPIKLWAFCGKYFSKDGRLTGMTKQQIEEECGWWGATGKMIEKMIEVRGSPDEEDKFGFLELDGGTFVVHDWVEHQGHIWAYKERAKAASMARWDPLQNRAKRNPSKNATSIPSSSTVLSSSPLPENGGRKIGSEAGKPKKLPKIVRNLSDWNEVNGVPK